MAELNSPTKEAQGKGCKGAGTETQACKVTMPRYKGNGNRGTTHTHGGKVVVARSPVLADRHSGEGDCNNGQEVGMGNRGKGERGAGKVGRNSGTGTTARWEVWSTVK